MLLHNRSIKEKLLKGGSWAFSGKLVTALAGLAINSLLARLLTPEELGAYFLILSLVSVVAIITQLGLTQVVVKLVAESIASGNPKRAAYAIKLTMRLLVLSSIVVGFIFLAGFGEWLLTHFFHLNLLSNIFFVIFMWVLILSFQQYIGEVYRGFHDIKLATIFGGLITSVISMLLFLLLWYIQGEGDLTQVVALTVVAGATSVVISSLFLWGKLKELPKSSDVALGSREVLGISIPLWVTSLTLVVLIQADIWILGVFASPDDVAIYGVAARTVALVTLPLLVVNAVLPPIISEMYEKGDLKVLELVLRKTAALVTSIGGLVFGLLFFYGEDVLLFFFGEYYRSGSLVLMILCLGQLLNIYCGSCGQVLMLAGQQVAMMMITIACGTFTVGLAYLLVVPYGVVGVASAASLGILAQNLMMLFMVKRKLGIWTHVTLSLFKR